METQTRYTGIDIRNVPENIRRAVDDDAREREMSVQDVVVQALARKWRVRVPATGYPYIGTEGSNHWNLRVPVELRDAIKATATDNGGTILGHVLATVARRYGIPYTPARRTPDGRLTPMIVNDLRWRHRQGESIRSLSRELGVKRETLSRAIRGTDGQEARHAHDVRAAATAAR